MVPGQHVCERPTRTSSHAPTIDLMGRDDSYRSMIIDGLDRNYLFFLAGSGLYKGRGPSNWEVGT
jgi:hypothetical protein